MTHTENEHYEFAVHHSEEDGKKVRKTIWNIFWVLLAITAVEVILGIFWKSWGLNWGLIKTTFIFLTIMKAYFIVAYYMHMRDEVKSFMFTVIVPYSIFVIYTVLILINEALALFDFDLLYR
jgi:cytochrome c oxidase subunit IV